MFIFEECISITAIQCTIKQNAISNTSPRALSSSHGERPIAAVRSTFNVQRVLQLSANTSPEPVNKPRQSPYTRCAAQLDIDLPHARSRLPTRRKRRAWSHPPRGDWRPGRRAAAKPAGSQPHRTGPGRTGRRWRLARSRRFAEPYFLISSKSRSTLFPLRQAFRISAYSIEPPP